MISKIFVLKPIRLQMLYNRSPLAHVFLVLYSLALGSSEFQGIASSWICFGLVASLLVVNIESGEPGDCMIVVGLLSIHQGIP